ncbi:MAG: hypothetical protein MUC74_13800 [Ideonella sp.]|jgi:uncharacterized protein (DUF302 family)|nr:hypothetical protein [Ideonella sp.]
METQAEPSFMRGRRPHPGGERRAPRRWMSSSLAVVMASVCSNLAAAAPTERRTQVRQSPYDVAETVRRIEAAAQATGFQVLASVEPPAPAPWRQRVVVLASSEGGTPVQLESPDALPDMPMALRVEAAADGSAVVRLSEVDPGFTDDSDWPSTVADELADLPRLVDQALR